MHMYNIVFIGDNGVGKETMIKTHIYSNTEVVSVTKIEVDIWHVHYLYVEDRLRELHLAFTHTDVQTYDGKENFLKHANAFVLVYSSLSARSFNSLRKFVSETFRHPKSVCNVPLILVATKVDQPDQQIQVEEGSAQAESWGIPFMPMSATDKEQLTVLFANLVKSIDLTRHSMQTTVELLARRTTGCCSIL